MRKHLLPILLGTVIASTSLVAVAQPANDPATGTVTTVDTREDHGFDWGLLGLLGLLGLIPRKRREVDHTRTTTNTNTTR